MKQEIRFIKDLQENLKFYRDKLLFETKLLEDEKGVGGLEVKKGDLILRLLIPNDPISKELKYGDMPPILVEIEDLAAYFNELETDVITEKLDDENNEIKFAVVDCNGFTLVFVEYLII